MQVVRRRRHSQSVGADPHVFNFEYATDGNPGQTLVYAPDVYEGVIAYLTEDCRTVLVAGTIQSRLLIEQIKSGLQDDFNRTTPIGATGSGRWGSTESAGKWDIRTGSDSDFYVSPSSGIMQAFTVNNSKRIAPSSYGYNYSTADVQVQVNADHMSVGDSLLQSIMLGYQDVNNHYLATLDWAPSVNMLESFNTNNVNGWGLEDDRGKTWTTTGTAANYYTTTGGTPSPDDDFGAHILTTLNSSRRCTVDSNSANDGTVELIVSFPTQPTVGSLFAGPILRYTDISNHYTARLRKNHTSDSNNADLDIQKTVAGVTTTIGTVNLGRLVNVGVQWNVKADITGTTISAKAWPVGESEPGAWQLQITDASLATGTRWGVRSIASPDLTNTLPIEVHFHSWRFTATPGDPAILRLQKREAGVTSDLATYNISSNENIFRENPGDAYIIRALRDGTDLKMKAWRYYDMEPADWQVSTTDATFGDGDIGLRAIVQTSWTGGLPVTWAWSDYYVNALWSNPPTIDNALWVYMLDEPFSGTITPEIEAWLTYKLTHEERDVLSVALEYVSNAPAVYRRSTASFTSVPDTGVPYGTKIAGDSGYGPRQTGSGDGTRLVGADFNDYVAKDVLYELSPSGTVLDHNEADEVTCTDCSGLLRLVFGIRNGLPLQGTDVDWTDRIPRISSEIALAAETPGIVLFNNAVRPVQAELDLLQVGDIVSFDADTSDPTEEEGQIDHNGIYLGLDVNGDMRFLSARKTVNGPTFSDVGGKSVLNGSGLYARSLRTARRF